MPNLPETVVAFLAVASLGAVWSACAPDMGQLAVLDRFRQIAPKARIAVDGYRYGGKTHELRGLLQELLAELPGVEHRVLLPNPDGRMRGRIKHALSARHVPNEIFQVPAIPRALSGKKLELPIKKLLLGRALRDSINRIPWPTRTPWRGLTPSRAPGKMTPRARLPGECPDRTAGVDPLRQGFPRWPRGVDMAARRSTIRLHTRASSRTAGPAVPRAALTPAVPLPEVAMKYLCLAYEAEETLNALSRSEWTDLREETLTYVESLRERGHLIVAQALQSARTAVTVRVRKGEPSVTDGPFAETREQLGGFFMIEAADLDEAVRIACAWPSARLGSIEVRPLEAELSPDGRYR